MNEFYGQRRKHDHRCSLIVLGDFLLLALDLAILFLVCGFFFIVDTLVSLVLFFESALGGLVDFAPFLADNFGDLCNFGIGILGLHIVIHLPPEQEEGREWFFWRSRLSNRKCTLVASLFFFPILYRLFTKDSLVS